MRVTWKNDTWTNDSPRLPATTLAAKTTARAAILRDWARVTVCAGTAVKRVCASATGTVQLVIMCSIVKNTGFPKLACDSSILRAPVPNLERNSRGIHRHLRQTQLTR